MKVKAHANKVPLSARRRFLGASAALGASVMSAGEARERADDRRRSPDKLRRIATEEAFALPEVSRATGEYMRSPKAVDEPGLAALFSSVSPKTLGEWGRRLVDLGPLRAAEMDQAGIATQILLMGSPGVQIFEPDEAVALARLANDRMATHCATDPYRYAALATIAPQAPRAAADELTRAVCDLRCRGALINSSTKGEYLDDPKFWPIFEAAQALEVPIYLHPRDPAPAMYKPYADARVCGSIWGYAAETGLHALRLILGGVFDAFPRLQVILGHAGEALPFFVDRIDTRHAVELLPGGARPLKRRPSDYLRNNFIVTTSGMNWALPIRLCLSVMGSDRVMFAADWPFEDAVEAVRTFEQADLNREERRKVLQANAERIFRLV